MPIFAWNVHLVSLIFLTRSLVFPILLFFSISLHWSLRKAFLSLLVILWDSAFKLIYLSFFPLLFTSLLFTAICKASSDSHFAVLHFPPPGGGLDPYSDYSFFLFNLKTYSCEQESYPRELPGPEIQTSSLSPELAGVFFTISTTSEAPLLNLTSLYLVYLDFFTEEHIFTKI